MKFNQYLSEQKLVNEVKMKHLLHLSHIEELVFFLGVEGAKQTIKSFQQIISEIGAHKTLMTFAKVDGAPSITAGWDPETKKFFVGSKSLFNKEPKINFTHDDIDRNHGHAPGLAKKLKEGLDHLPKVVKKGEIVAGDFMYSNDDLKTATIDGTNVITFTPNTITYAVDSGSDLADVIKKSKIGVIFHTSYTGNSIATMKASFKISNSQFNTSSDVYVRTTEVSLDNIAWSSEDAGRLKSDMSSLKQSFNQLDHNQINSIADDKKLSQVIMTYINAKVREGKRFDRNEIGNLIDFIISKYDKEKFKLSSESGKDKKETEKQAFIKTIREYASTLYYLFQWSYSAEDIKHIIIKKLEEIELPEKPYNLNSNGQYEVVGAEGFVVSDSPDSAVKFVNRSIFSRNNFMNTRFD